MDFIKLGKAIILLGALILVFGCYKWFTNQPKNLYNVVADTYKIEELNTTNIRREGNRDEASKIIIAGGIGVFLGLGISYSAKKKE